MESDLHVRQFSIAIAFSGPCRSIQIKLDWFQINPHYSDSTTWITNELRIENDKIIAVEARRINHQLKPPMQLTIEIHEKKLRIIDDEGDRSFSEKLTTLDNFMSALRALAK
jgi:hypothetical protein